MTAFLQPQFCSATTSAGAMAPCACLRCRRRLNFDPSFDRLTHYLFRYPAKFHPPLARKLIEEYSQPDECILDPFCGSGTLLVESASLGRHAIGTDIDPVAIFVAQAKTHRCIPSQLAQSAASLTAKLQTMRRSEKELKRRMFVDLPATKMRRAIAEEKLWVPLIPNIEHSFRRYVVVDLARIAKAIDALDVPNTHRQFFSLLFASTIRNSSNADPVPVSGLEVTAHMLRKQAAGRLIDPYALMDRAMREGLVAATAFREKAKRVQIAVEHRDALTLAATVKERVDVVITSPPYHNAVDYYRRHTLEMYWLRLTENHDARLQLVQKYIGRSQVRNGHRFISEEFDMPLTRKWFDEMAFVSRKRANAFRHYMLSMREVMRQLAGLLTAGKKAIFVVGHSRWQGVELPTSDLLEEAADEWFEPLERLWYPVKNRYMSYQRKNGADIAEEHVLVLRRREACGGI